MKTAKERYDEEMTTIRANGGKQKPDPDDEPPLPEEPSEQEDDDDEEEEEEDDDSDEKEEEMSSQKPMSKAAQPGSPILAKLLRQHEKNPIQDPICSYLIAQKVKLASQFLRTETIARTTYQTLMSQVRRHNRDGLKLKGAIENIDQELLAWCAKHPEVLGEQKLETVSSPHTVSAGGVVS
jgi:hypothetical protein